MIATGRSDFPNQVNNVLCFPFIFRGALDVGATIINTEMELAAVKAIAGSRRPRPPSRSRSPTASRPSASARIHHPQAVRPAPHRARRPAVARAMESAWPRARSPISTRTASRSAASSTTRASSCSRSSRRRRSSRAGWSTPKARTSACCARRRSWSTRARAPTLIGRPQVIEQRLERLGLRVRPGKEFELVNPESDPRYREYWTTYQQLTERQGRRPAMRASRCGATAR